MFTIQNLKRALLVLTLLCLLPVLASTWNRVAIESEARMIQFVLDSEEVWQMVQRLPEVQEEDYERALKAFKDAGVDALALYPVSFGSLEERGLAMSYDWKQFTQVLQGGGMADFAEELGVPGVAHWYVLIPDTTLGERVEELLGDREQSLQWRFLWGEERLLIEIPSVYWVDYRRAGLWYDEDELALARSLGYALVPRTSLLPGQTPEQLDEMFAPFVASRNVSMLLPTGNALNGVSDAQGLGFGGSGAARQDFVDLILSQRWPYGLIENMNQLDSIRFVGDNTVLTQSDFHAIRVYAIQRAELDKENWLDSEGIVDRWFRAVVDRNIRGIYVRLFSGTLKDPERILSLNQNLVRQSTMQMREAGYYFAQPTPLQPLHFVNQMLLLTPLLGLAWAWFFVNGYSWRKPLWPLLLTLGCLGGVVAVGYLARSNATLVGSWVTMRQVLGLAAHVIYPTMAGIIAIIFLERLPRSANLLLMSAQAALLAVAAFVVALLGGMNLGVLLTDNLFMLELEYFRGVKVSYMLPIFLFALWFFVRYGLTLSENGPLRRPARTWRDFYEDLHGLFKRPLTLGLMAALGVVAVAGWYYLGRSGHDAGVAISETELQLRTWLEGMLIARPRNKEFLIGYPALMLLPLLWRYKKLRWLILPAGAVAMTGLISVVNSFAHIRTPLMISIERGFYGLLLGLLCGLVALLLGYGLFWLARRLGFVTVDRDD